MTFSRLHTNTHSVYTVKEGQCIFLPRTAFRITCFSGAISTFLWRFRSSSLLNGYLLLIWNHSECQSNSDQLFRLMKYSEVKWKKETFLLWCLWECWRCASEKRTFKRTSLVTNNLMFSMKIPGSSTNLSISYRCLSLLYEYASALKFKRST